MYSIHVCTVLTALNTCWDLIILITYMYINGLLRQNYMYCSNSTYCDPTITIITYQIHVKTDVHVHVHEWATETELELYTCTCMYLIILSNFCNVRYIRIELIKF